MSAHKSYPRSSTCASCLVVGIVCFLAGSAATLHSADRDHNTLGLLERASAEKLLEALAHRDPDVQRLALAGLLKKKVLTQGPAVRKGDWELQAFVQARANTPSRENATRLALGVQVTNRSKQPLTFWPGSLHLMLKWGDRAWQHVGINRDGLGRPKPVPLPPGESRIVLVQHARLAYIGRPKYLAFVGHGFVPGDYFECRLAGLAKEISFEFRHHLNQHEVMRATAGPVSFASR